jgi:uncharacterized pyridoxal phosphate-containing UPF0001 family protein
MLEQNLALVQQRIARAAERAGRDPRDITLVAVSKTFPVETILAAYALGIRHFGENRIEEATQKIPTVNSRITPPIIHHLALGRSLAKSQSQRRAAVVRCDSLD